MALTDNLISVWELEEASGTRNDSHGTNHLTDNNTVGQEAGKVGNSALFVASNSEFLSITHNASVCTGNIDFSLAGWVYVTVVPTSGASIIAAKGSGNAVDPNDDYALYYHGALNRFRFLVCDGAGNFGVKSADSFGVPSDATWYFLVAWHDSVANTVNIQVNNGTVDSVSYSFGGNPSGTASSFRLGWDGVFQYWNGGLDQLIFAKRVWSAGERTQLYNSGNGLSYAAMSTVLNRPSSVIVRQAVHRAASW